MFKFILFIIFLFSSPSFSMKILDNKNPKINVFGNKWELVTDEVMGGKSSGEFVIHENNNTFFYRLEGDVSTENNGGFIQLRSKISISNQPFSGIRFKVRGSGDEYFIHVRTSFTLLPWQYYFAKFKTSSNWKTVEIPFSELAKSHIFQPSNISSDSIKTLGFVAFGKDFKAKLDITEIELYN